jgi:integrase
VNALDRPHGRIAPAAGALVQDLAVSERAARRMAEAIPDNTRRAYGRVWDGRPHPDAEPPAELERRGFLGWCELNGRTALPATPETLAEYVSHLVDWDLSPSTIEQSIAAIRTMHRYAEYGRHFPDADKANLILRTHRRDRAGRGLSGQRQALPVVVESLRKMVDTIDTSTVVGARDHALLLLGIVAFGRRSEIAAFRWEDLRDAPEGLVLRIRMSKTDQDARGENVPVLQGAFPGTDPVRVIARWRETLASQTSVRGPLLRSVDQHGRIGNAMHPNSINRVVQRRARLAGLMLAEETEPGDEPRRRKPDGYSAHSLRAGAATIAYMNGAPISAICRLGRWKPGSQAVLGYIRSVDQWKDHPFRGVL